MHQFRAIYCITILFAFIFSMPAYAQNETSASDTYRPVTIDSGPHNGISKPDNTINDGYVAPTFERLSRLYWTLAMFDLGDNAAIDNYLLINECELHSKYFNNDFEMEDLRAATKQSIVKNMASFDNKFEILIPVGLDRYDTGKEKFKMSPDSDIIAVKRLEIRLNDNPNACGNKFIKNVPGYPKNFILSLSRPFTLTEFPVSPEVAQAYIEESLKTFESNPGQYKDVSKYGRVAYIRFKVTMSQFRQYIKIPNNPPMTEIFGTIDGYEVYADIEKQLLLSKQTVLSDQKKIYRRKKIDEPQLSPDENQGAATDAPNPASDPASPVEPGTQP